MTVELRDENKELPERLYLLEAKITKLEEEKRAANKFTDRLLYFQISFLNVASMHPLYCDALSYSQTTHLLGRS